MQAYVFKRFLAFLIAGTLVAGLLSVIIFIKQSDIVGENEVIVREVDFALPPPPPPPPEKTEFDDSPVDMSVDVALNAAGPALQYSKKPELKQTFIPKLKKPKFDIKKVDWKRSFRTDFPEVDMSELDKTPTIITNTKARIPRKLRQKGVRQVKVKLKILIDETGKTYLRRFVDSVYPEMEPVVRDYIKTVKFTPPTRDGRPVHAVYSWTLSFKEIL